MRAASGAGGSPITDPDSGALEGVAVTGVDDSNGTWQYDANADGTWLAFGAVSDASAVLLETTALIRFVPDPDYNGTAGDLTFRAWDQTSGSNGATSVNVSVNGGTTAFSTATETATLTVTPVQDAPVLTIPGGAVGYTENDPAVIIDPSAMATACPDSGTPRSVTTGITAR